jgi:hypothetical protein
MHGSYCLEKAKSRRYKVTPPLRHIRTDRPTTKQETFYLNCIRPFGNPISSTDAAAGHSRRRQETLLYAARLPRPSSSCCRGVRKSIARHALQIPGRGNNERALSKCRVTGVRRAVSLVFAQRSCFIFLYLDIVSDFSLSGTGPRIRIDCMQGGPKNERLSVL